MDKRDYLIAYDIGTASEDGDRRLRKVATALEEFGQRVQYSLFECSIDQSQLEELEHRLLGIIDEETDSLRIYRLYRGREESLTSHGVDDYTDYDDPLVV